MHARHFSPITGRFLTFDPVAGTPGTPQSWNRYAYVMGNPLKYVDPDGKTPVGAFAAKLSLIAQILHARGLLNIDFEGVKAPVIGLGVRGVSIGSLDLTEALDTDTNVVDVTIQLAVGLQGRLNLDGLLYSVPIVEDGSFLFGPIQTTRSEGSHLPGGVTNAMTGGVTVGVFSANASIPNADELTSAVIMLLGQGFDEVLATAILEKLQTDGHLKEGYQLVLGELIRVKKQ